MPTGTGLGKYRILERIKTSHNAIIYKARDIMLDRLVTIKQMSPELIDDPIACGTFRREAQFLARVPRGHAYVVSIHEMIEDDLGLFIVEEYMPGSWLELLIAKRMLDLNDAVRVLRTMALGLRTLHSLGVTHRGIHPGNILVSKSRRAKIASLSTASHESDTTPPPVVAPKYAAPELLLGREYDDRVDIYSLGMVLFEMCVGRPALNRHFANLLVNSAAVKIRWIEWQLDARTSLPNASDLNPHVPPRVAALIRNMTAKDLNERIPTIREVLDALGPAEGVQPALAYLPGRFETILLGEMPYAPAPRVGHLLPTLGQAALPYLPAAGVGAARPAAPASTFTIQVQPGPEEEEGRTGLLPPAPAHAAASPAASRVHPRVRHRPSRAGLRSSPSVTEVPSPPPTAPAKERPPRRLAKLLAAGILLAVSATILGIGWHYAYGFGPAHQIQAVLRAAAAAYEKGELKTAEEKYRQAASMEVPERWQHERDQAEMTLMVVEAARQLEADDLDGAEAKLREAERRGANQSRVDAVKRKLWAKRDAYRLAEESTRDLERGDTAAAESRLDEYEEKARASGVDPNELRDRLELSRREKKYATAIRQANQALNKDDFDAALLACTDAENVKVTSETRALHKRILDRRDRAALVVRGDDAMADRDFAAATSAYEKAIQLETTPELEVKLRKAGAAVLYVEALTAIANGDLLGAEQRLQSSLWKHRTEEAQTKLTKMAPAFEAARIARKADAAAQRKDYGEAERLYKLALPNLPEPAKRAVENKLRQLQQGASAFPTLRDRAGRQSQPPTAKLGSVKP